MPTLWAHSHYWSRQSTVAQPPETGSSTGVVGYPAWQASVIIGSGLGSMQGLYERLLGDKNGEL
jgi:hypothetical protein